MEAQEIIKQCREGNEPSVYLKHFQYKANGSQDCNLEKRTQVVESLLNSFTNKDIELIRLLYLEEINCELAIERHDNLYQICYYLYSLGNLEDVYKIYSAKFDSSNFDTATMLDRGMLYMSHKIEEVMSFVKNQNSQNRENRLKELQDLKDQPDDESEQDYQTFINGYFFGHKGPSSLNPSNKWWQFWK